MILEARSRSCFSSHFVLKLDDRPVGEFRARSFTEGVDVRWTGRRRFRFDKESFLDRHFRLTDVATGSVLAEAERSGMLTSAWSLTLSTGPARLVSSGWFNGGWHVERDGRKKAETNRIGMCEGGWWVRDDGTLSDTDLLFTGLLYAAILRRRAAVVAASS